MNPNVPHKRIYRCPVCGAELTVLAAGTGEFRPRCCNRDMIPQSRGLAFYVCPVCGAEVGVLLEGGGQFEPRCCNTNMNRRAA
jgi:desulfoferrodoxin-like iron-binding protein